MRKIIALVMSLGMSLFAHTLLATPTDSSDIHILSAVYDPCTIPDPGDQAGENIVICNDGGTDVDLLDWGIDDNSGTAPSATETFGAGNCTGGSCILAANSCEIIAIATQAGVDDHYTALSTTQPYPTFAVLGLSSAGYLNNSGDTVTLFDNNTSAMACFSYEGGKNGLCGSSAANQNTDVAGGNSDSWEGVEDLTGTPATTGGSCVTTAIALSSVTAQNQAGNGISTTVIPMALLLASFLLLSPIYNKKNK